MMKKKFYTTPSVLVVEIEADNIATLVSSPGNGNTSTQLGDNGADEEFDASSYRSTIWN